MDWLKLSLQDRKREPIEYIHEIARQVDFYQPGQRVKSGNCRSDLFPCLGSSWWETFTRKYVQLPMPTVANENPVGWQAARCAVLYEYHIIVVLSKDNLPL
jgi:hypothetical protein